MQSAIQPLGYLPQTQTVSSPAIHSILLNIQHLLYTFWLQTSVSRKSRSQRNLSQRPLHRPQGSAHDGAARYSPFLRGVASPPGRVRERCIAAQRLVSATLRSVSDGGVGAI